MTTQKMKEKISDIIYRKSIAFYRVKDLPRTDKYKAAQTALDTACVTAFELELLTYDEAMEIEERGRKHVEKE